MLTTALLSFVLLNVAFTLGEEDTDCLPPHQGGPHMHGERECCSAPSLGTDMHDKMHECMAQSGVQKPGRGSGPPDDDKMDCVDQCTWKSMGFVDEDGAIIKAALEAKITETYTGAWASVATAAMNKCEESAMSKISESSTCKSGARQLMNCFSREMFLNCPKDSWTESDQCTQIQQIFKKCENKPAMMMMHGGGGGGGRHHGGRRHN